MLYIGALLTIQARVINECTPWKETCSPTRMNELEIYSMCGVSNNAAMIKLQFEALVAVGIGVGLGQSSDTFIIGTCFHQFHNC